MSYRFIGIPIGKMGEYELFRYEDILGPFVVLLKGEDVYHKFTYSKWLENTSIEYWLKEYIDLCYKQYQAKYDQIEELMKERKIIEEDILDVSNTLDYYRGFKKEEDIRKEALDELLKLSQELGL